MIPMLLLWGSLEISELEYRSWKHDPTSTEHTDTHTCTDQPPLYSEVAGISFTISQLLSLAGSVSCLCCSDCLLSLWESPLNF